MASQTRHPEEGFLRDQMVSGSPTLPHYLVIQSKKKQPQDLVAGSQPQSSFTTTITLNSVSKLSTFSSRTPPNTQATYFSTCETATTVNLPTIRVRCSWLRLFVTMNYNYAYLQSDGRTLQFHLNSFLPRGGRDCPFRKRCRAE